MELKSKPFTPEQQQWIAQQNEISRQERLAVAIEDLTAEISTLNERLAPCDFTNWPLSMCTSNLVAVLEKKQEGI